MIHVSAVKERETGGFNKSGAIKAQTLKSFHVCWRLGLIKKEPKGRKMMKRKLIAICALSIFLMLVGTVKANQIVSVVDSTSGQEGTVFFPGGATSGYLISGPDWGWTHTFTFDGPEPPESIISATLVIKQFGVLLYDEHEIFLDGVSLGYLDNGFDVEETHYTTFNISWENIANLLDGEANIWLDIDWPNTVAIYSSTLIINYVPSGLESISIDGPAVVNEDSVAQFTCTAHYEGGGTSDISSSVSWTDNSDFATVDSDGLLTALPVTQDEPCQIKAALGEYTTATFDITIINVVPKVSITAVTSAAAEPDVDGLLEVHRTGSTQDSLQVYYNVFTTAESGVDFAALPGVVEIPAGETSADILIDVINDENEEVEEMVGVALKLPDPDDGSYELDDVNPISATVTITDDDGVPPSSSGHSPSMVATQVARDTLIKLHITDDGGVGNVKIKVEGDVIYDGTVDAYNTMNSGQAVRGVCRRYGESPMDYLYIFQPSILFGYEQKVDVEIIAKDIVGREFTETYYFYTLMRSFGKNIKVNTGSDTLAQNNPTTARDSDGNIWVVWEHAVAAGNSDIYIGKLLADGSAFEASQVVFSDIYDKRYPAIAIDSGNKLHVVWQGKDSTGFWDIFISSSNDVDGIIWGAPVKVSNHDPDNENNQTMPAIAIDAADKIYIAWEDDSQGTLDKNIRAASSSNPMSWPSSEEITNAINNQITPVIDILSGSVPYVFWASAENASDDIFSSKYTGIWEDGPYVNAAGGQTNPAVSIDGSGIVHLLWIEEDPVFVGFDDLYYGNNSQGDSITDGFSIVDQSNARPSSPSIVTENGEIFACWRDSRNLSNNNDTDIYYTSKSSDSEFRTNVLVNDDAGTFTQTTPDMGLDKVGDPYMVWVDDREGNNDIYAAFSTSISEIVSVDVDPTSGVTEIVQVDPTTDNIDSADDVKIEIPAGALSINAQIKISKMNNPPDLPPGAFGIFYDFGPSGLTFNVPVTISIPHKASECPGHAEYRVYFYDPTILGGFPWSQEGITNVQHLTSAEDPTLPADVHVVRFNTTHFTSFGVGGGAPSGGGGVVVGGGGGGGDSWYGCAVCTVGEVDIVEFLLPFIVFIIVLAILTVHDARARKARG